MSLMVQRLQRRSPGLPLRVAGSWTFVEPLCSLSPLGLKALSVRTNVGATGFEFVARA